MNPKGAFPYNVMPNVMDNHKSDISYKQWPLRVTTTVHFLSGGYTGQVGGCHTRLLSSQFKPMHIMSLYL